MLNVILPNYSAIHQAASRTIPGFDWHNSCGMEKKPLIGEWSLKTVPAGGRQSGCLVNSAVRVTEALSCKKAWQQKLGSGLSLVESNSRVRALEIHLGT